MWGEFTTETDDREMHHVHGQRLGAGAISLLSEETGAATATMTFAKETENEDTSRGIIEKTATIGE
jgi:hypothetical protein